MERNTSSKKKIIETNKLDKTNKKVWDFPPMKSKTPEMIQLFQEQ